MLTAGCASPEPPTSANVPVSVKADLQKNLSTIIFMRKDATPYAAGVDLFIDGEKVAFVHEDEYVEIYVPPGNHAIETTFPFFPFMLPPDKRSLTLSTNPGERVYISLGNMPYKDLLKKGLAVGLATAAATGGLVTVSYMGKNTLSVQPPDVGEELKMTLRPLERLN
jgi:hypothetical protein